MNEWNESNGIEWNRTSSSLRGNRSRAQRLARGQSWSSPRRAVACAEEEQEDVPGELGEVHLLCDRLHVRETWLSRIPHRTKVRASSNRESPPQGMDRDLGLPSLTPRQMGEPWARRKGCYALLPLVVKSVILADVSGRVPIICDIYHTIAKLLNLRHRSTGGGSYYCYFPGQSCGTRRKLCYPRPQYPCLNASTFSKTND